MTQPIIRFEGVSKAFGTQTVLRDFSLDVEPGAFVSIIGRSGCGKTTVLKLVNGLLSPDTGRVLIQGQDVARIDPVALRRRIGYAIQNVGLFPHMTVEKNIAYVPAISGLEEWKGKQCREKVAALLKQVGLDPALAGRYPRALSGGQRQRVGIARAFAANPPIVLMDEPFSALDPMTRAELQNEIHDLQTKAQKTVVFVTHDMDEAIKLADRICIIQDGKVAQCDTPENILKHPANQYVTEFIGANRLWANPEYIRAADIMRRRPFTISKGRTVIQALQIMRHNSVDSLLVLDKGQTLLGVVWLEELIGKREADPIEYYISDDYIAVEGETSLKEIIATIDYDVSGIIPVIQHDRKLLGYLTKSIILATMSKQFVPEHTAGERSGVICPATL